MERPDLPEVWYRQGATGPGGGITDWLRERRAGRCRERGHVSQSHPTCPHYLIIRSAQMSTLDFNDASWNVGHCLSPAHDARRVRMVSRLFVSDAAAEMEKSWWRGGQWRLAGLARYHWNVGRERPAARQGSPAGLLCLASPDLLQLSYNWPSSCSILLACLTGIWVKFTKAGIYLDLCA